ncbi:hypothetical protein B0J17DRAFT_721724 [Rhizoctonia solani]|nr:hypothetical protein B0J17DRAFT_721724 [Rhizoctonia solani]
MDPKAPSSTWGDPTNPGPTGSSPYAPPFSLSPEPVVPTLHDVIHTSLHGLDQWLIQLKHVILSQGKYSNKQSKTLEAIQQENREIRVLAKKIYDGEDSNSNTSMAKQPKQEEGTPKQKGKTPETPRRFPPPFPGAPMGTAGTSFLSRTFMQPPPASTPGPSGRTATATPAPHTMHSTTPAPSAPCSTP